MVRYSISLVVHKNLPLTERIIYQIRTLSKDFELFLTDNASGDGTDRYFHTIASSSRDPVTVILNPTNEGFGKPHNAAFTRARGEFFVVLNNDIELCHGWLDRMVAEFEKDPFLALCGVRDSCTELRSDGCGIPGPTVDYVEASCLMVRTELARKHGLFDPAYEFAYSEDADLSLRMKSLGYKIAAIDLPIKHYRAMTSRIVAQTMDLGKIQEKNRALLTSRWRNYFEDKSYQGRVIVQRGGARGDVLLSTPILRALRKRHPRASIAYSTGCPDILQQNPYINEFLGYPVAQHIQQSCKFHDLDLAYESEPRKHVVQAYLDRVGIQEPDWRLDISISESDRADALRTMTPERKWAAIHTGLIPAWMGRQWSPEKFEHVATYLHSRGWGVLRIGDASSPDISFDADCRGAGVLRTAAFIERCELFVGLDSMPFHLAQATRRPIVAVFGCVDPALRVIPGGRTIPVTLRTLTCLGCHHRLPAPRTITTTCERGREPCMTDLTSTEVIQAIERVVDLYPVTPPPPPPPKFYRAL